ncbi:hypothetical protein PAXINDRAFT_177893 [Paxillus involutus ATCC 200175]|nr:hypothetical protein PAXINDRAFT_177893 [Paxillus involutus ATCC 200175]
MHVFLQYAECEVLQDSSVAEGVRDRTKTLDVDSNFYATCTEISHELIPRGLPMLERFRITLGKGFPCTRTMRQSIPAYLFDTGSAWALRGPGSPQGQMNELLPRLTELSLTGTFAFWNFWAITNLATLTINHLELSFRLHLHDLRYILMQNANSLERLELHASIRRPSESGLPSITLPRLRHLHLGFISQFEALEFLQALQAPSLKTLHLCDVPRMHHFQRRRSSANVPPLPVANLHTGEDFDSSALLHSLCVTPPAFLTRIESLTLTSIYLIRQEPAWCTDVLTRSIPPSAVCPVRLMQTMTSLKTLTLHMPDNFFLQSLNFPIPVPGTETDAQPCWTYPASQISNLTITHLSYWDLKFFDDEFYTRNKATQVLANATISILMFKARNDEREAKADALHNSRLDCVMQQHCNLIPMFVQRPEVFKANPRQDLHTWETRTGYRVLLNPAASWKM